MISTPCFGISKAVQILSNEAHVFQLCIIYYMDARNRAMITCVKFAGVGMFLMIMDTLVFCI